MRKSGNAEVAAPLSIAALRVSYAVGFSKVDQKSINLPPARQTGLRCTDYESWNRRTEERAKEFVADVSSTGAKRRRDQSTYQPARVTQNS
jgi:hypothetical protein